jgi:hypothetical protein
VIGHRDTGRTACPGGLLYGQLAELRTMVSTGIANVPSYATRLNATLGDYDLDFGDVVPLAGSLFGATGSPLPAEAVQVQVNGDGRWKTTKRIATATDGSFATELKPRKRLYVRLRFPGRGELRRTSSPRLLVRLHPVVTLRRPARSATLGLRVAVRGTVAPRKRTVRLVLQQRIRGRFRKVGARAVRARQGSFRTSFVPAFRALYRYAIVAKSDDDTDRGSSGWRMLRVR